MSLTADCRAYLRAGPNRLVRDAAGFFEVRDRDTLVTTFVWVEDDAWPATDGLTERQREERDARERGLLERFEAEMSSRPGSRGVYLVPAVTGMSAGFRSSASDLLGDDGGVRVPVQFFDTEYRHERSKQTRRRYSSIRQIFVAGRTLRRVPQPFYIRTGLGHDDRVRGEGDLVEHLVRAMSGPAEEPCLRVIDGSAGSGKTVAFNALADALYKAFRDAKRRLERVPRPVAFNEGHLRGTGPDGEGTPRAADLIRSLLSIELARAVSPDQFEWLLTNGLSQWLFDGLDEIYDGDPTFFDTLDALLTAEGSRAQVLLCTRDSLLGSSQALRRFVQSRLDQGLPVEIYELAPWDETAWQRAAWIRLEAEVEGKQTSPRVQGFVEQVQSSPILAELATLPFYCDQLLQMAEQHELEITDEFDVIEAIVDRMLDREHSKEMFDWSDFADTDLAGAAWASEAEPADVLDALRAAGRETIEELLEVIAFFARRAVVESGPRLPVQLVRDMLELRSGDVDGDAQVALVQFAFFGMGDDADAVDFSHPIIAEYLAARYAVKNLHATSTVNGVEQSLGRMSVPPGKGFVRYLKREGQRDPAVRERLRSAHDSGELAPKYQAFVGMLLGG